ncbi:hypothetical protein XELAEV_18021240mg [Xenopus laevis]|uniref:G-protein coupled receptors family 1 profile domain-containing protein n=1 Tax=Xenopus laevis TaxID=8355 RepID=A0A974HRH1_XENLA|nr:hypothetical protein XELAEV_18021240mg [Xenopus laevis]
MEGNSTPPGTANNITVMPTIFPRSGYIILSFLMFLNAVFSICNNVVVILVTLRYPQLRNPINIFILNLSFSDLMMALCGTTIVVSTNYYGYFYLGEQFCIFQGFAVNYFGIVSLWSLTLLAYERYNVVCEPIGALKMSPKRGHQGLMFIWFFCLIWAVAPLFGWSSYGPEGVQTSCSIGWEERSWNNYSYIITYFLTSYLRVVVMVLFMVLAFMICWLPYTVFALIVVINPQFYISPLAATLPTYFAKTSPVYNPIIYIFLNKQFRGCAVECLTCGHIKHESQEENMESGSVQVENTLTPKTNQVAPA